MKVGSMLCCNCAVVVQPHVVHCSVCKAVDGMHFVRDLISSDQAHKDHNSRHVSTVHPSSYVIFSRNETNFVTSHAI